MVKNRASTIDRTLSSSALPTRRRVLLRLKDEPGLSVSELARPLSLELPGMMKHLDVLSDAGLITRPKPGGPPAHPLGPARGFTFWSRPMQEAMEWLNRFERLWTVGLDRLVALVEERPGLAFESPA